MIRTRHANPDIQSVPEAMGNIRADYDAARNNRFRRKRVGVAASGSGADYHYRNPVAFYSTMELARDIYRNHSKVGQGIRRLVANIIQQGFVYDPDTGKGDLNTSLAQRWADWSEDPDQCDMAGEETFTALTCLALIAMMVDGDIFALLSDKGPLKMAEAHRAKTPTNTKRNVVLGILLDKHRRRKELWLTKDEIDPSRAVARVSEMVQYPFRDVLGHRQIVQLYWPDRVNQTRGVTAFQQAITTADHGDDLEFAQLLKAQMQACYTILRQLKEGAVPQAAGQHGERIQEPRPDGTIQTIEGIGPAMEIFGYPGETLTGFAANVPNSEYFQHMMQVLTTIAVNLDLPVQVLLLDPTMTNFSGWRGAMDQAKFRWRQFQDRLKQRWHDPIVTWKIRQWLADDPGLRKMVNRKAVNVHKHDWHPPTWPYIEPLKDAQADLLRVRNAQTSPRRFASSRGMDWPKLIDEIVEDTSLLVEQAHTRALELNKKYPGLNISWREIASLPTPDGVTIALAPEEEPFTAKTSGGNNEREKTNAA